MVCLVWVGEGGDGGLIYARSKLPLHCHRPPHESQSPRQKDMAYSHGCHGIPTCHGKSLPCPARRYEKSLFHKLLRAMGMLVFFHAEGPPLLVACIASHVAKLTSGLSYRIAAAWTGWVAGVGIGIGIGIGMLGWTPSQIIIINHQS